MMKLNIVRFNKSSTSSFELSPQSIRGFWDSLLRRRLRISRVSSWIILCIFMSLIFSTLFVSIIEAENDWVGEAEKHYQKENYEEVIRILRQVPINDSDPRIRRIAGLTYFHLLDYTKARPLLEKALALDSGDREVARALGTILMEYDESEKALLLVAPFTEEAPDDYGMLLLKARIFIALNRDDEAIPILKKLMSVSDARAGKIALELAPIFIKQGNISQAVDVMGEALHSAPESYEAAELQYTLDYLENKGIFVSKDTYISADLGYRLESDDNITVLKEFAEEYETRKDIRHTVSAKLETLKLLNKEIGLMGEANILLSKQKEFDQYDQLQQYYRLGGHYTKNRYGFYFNYLFSHRDFNGNFYHRSHAVTPGAYFRLSENSLFYGFAKYTGNDYVNYVPAEEDHTFIKYVEKDYIESFLAEENPEFSQFTRNDFVNYVPAAENRSGHEATTGAMGQISFLKREGRVYFIYSSTHDLTYGRNWERIERLHSGQIEYPILKKLKGKLGYQEEKHDYLHLHTVYDKKRKDIIRRLVASLSYRPTEHWEIKLEGNWIKRSSNIEYYSYTQRIVGFGLYWHFD